MLEFLTPAVQNLLALALVALATMWLIARAVRRRKSKACGCGECPATAPHGGNADLIPLEDVLADRN